MSSTLVLYDTTAAWGYLGELYAMGAANLSGHFGTYVAKPVARYVAGDMGPHTATIYLGSTYDEPLPAAFLNDVLASTKPVIWCGFNIWQLTARADQTGTSFTTRYGWTWAGIDTARIDAVDYKGESLTRDGANNAGGIMRTTVVDPAKATVLATVTPSAGTAFPWAIRGGTLTYVGEIPFTYMSERDRYLAFADLLFDALAPATPTRRRALVRIEDVSASSDPAQLRAIADYLASASVPFGVAVIAQYRDPAGFYNNGIAETINLNQSPQVREALKYMVSKGGVLLMHGHTHQWDGAINPYSRVSGDDYEFFRVTENPDHSLTYVGSLPVDTTTSTNNAINGAQNKFRNAGLADPTIFEFPHYTGSATSYRTVATRFSTRWERSLYYGGVLGGGTVNHSRMFGQFFPYVVKDVYGSRVLPENLGNVEPEPWFIYPARLPADIVNSAKNNLVVRDGFASFYFHPFLWDWRATPQSPPSQFLQQTVTGIKALGYTFVSPNDPSLNVP